MEEQEKLLSEIHQTVTQMNTSLFGIEGTEDKGFVGRTNASLARHGERIGSLERYRWILAGGIIIIVFLAEVAAKVMK